MALGKKRTPTEYQDVLGSCLEEFLRLSRIIQSLLFHAKAEGNPGSGTPRAGQSRRGPVNGGMFYESSAVEAGVTLRVETPAVWVQVDRTLVQQAERRESGHPVHARRTVKTCRDPSRSREPDTVYAEGIWAAVPSIDWVTVPAKGLGTGC